MTDRERKMRRDLLERYRVLEEETTDPLAAGFAPRHCFGIGSRIEDGRNSG
jgi:hypothetical protein